MSQGDKRIKFRSDWSDTGPASRPDDTTGPTSERLSNLINILSRSETETETNEGYVPIYRFISDFIFILGILKVNSRFIMWTCQVSNQIITWNVHLNYFNGFRGRRRSHPLRS